MVTLAIAAVLIGLALPAFNAFVAQRTLTAQVNDFLVVCAIRAQRGQVDAVTVVSVRGAYASDAANEWGPGLVRRGRQSGARPRAMARSLRSYRGLGDNTLNGDGARSDGIGTLTFNSRGLLAATG